MSKIALIGVPFDLNSSFLRGAARAPAFIRQALHSPSSNLWSEPGIEIGSQLVEDYGDLSIHSNEEAFEQIRLITENALNAGLKPLYLGGDHAITFPILQALHPHYPDIHILHFDAHPDLYDEFEGNRFSHACPFARIMEHALAEQVIQIGVRCFNSHQREQAEKFNIHTFEMKDLKSLPQLISNKPIYVSFDLDVLDPAFAPGVSHPEPGGLSTREAIQILHGIRGRLIGADVVEYNPDRDLNNITAMTAAKIVKELAARLA